MSEILERNSFELIREIRALELLDFLWIPGG